jgi:outer membrane protein
MITRSVFFFFFLAFVVQALGQSQVLEGYIQEGLKSNLQLKQEQLNYERSVENLDASRSLFLPQVSAVANYTLAGGGRKISFPVGDLLNPVYTTLNQLTGSNSFPQIENVNTQFLPNDFHDTKLRVIQNIFNPDIYFAYKAQKELITVQQAQKKAYENELKFNIASAYYQYMQSTEALNILNKTHTLLQELLRVNQKLVANAKATKDVVLSAEYEISKVEQQIAESEKNNQVAKSYFNFLLNRDFGNEIIQDSTIASSVLQEQSVQQLKEQALGQRQELKQLEGGLRANEQLVGLQKGSAFLPKLNAVGDIGYQGFQYKFDSPQQYYLVQFGLSWDVFKGGEKRTKIQQARIDQQVMENRMEQLKKQIELQVIQAHYELEMTKTALHSSESGVKSTERSFQIVRSKYNELLRKEAALQKTIASL